MIDPATGRFWASWQDEGEPASLADIELDGAEAAIEWGRERSERGLIRLGNRGDTYFSAGSLLARGDEGPLPVWPPRAVPPGGWWEPPRVPTLEEIERVFAEVTAATRTVEDAVRWAMDRLGRAIEENAPGDVQAALTRLIGLGPPGLRRD